MGLISRRFDSFFPGVNADKLKGMARQWGAKGQLRKDECIAYLHQAMSEPSKVRALVAGLEPFERFGLGLLKQNGGEMEVQAFAVGIFCSGTMVPPRLYRGYRSGASEIFDHFHRRGLIMSAYAYDPGYLYGRESTQTIFSDERLLCEVGSPAIIPLNIKPVAAPLRSTFRRPQIVALDVISILQAIDNLGGLQTTKAGMVRNTELRKLMRALKWEEDEVSIDGFRFPSPAQAWISVLSQAGLLGRQEDRLALRETPGQFANRSYTEQAALLVDGFIRTTHWNEQWKEHWQSFHDNYYSYARLALKLALTALPTEPEAWFETAEIDAELFERIGKHFSLDYLPSQPYFFNRTSEEIRTEEAEWLAKLRQSWLKRERKWLEQALTSWLYFLGIVELGIEKGSVERLRLTELGRSLLHPELEAQPEHSSEGEAPPWIVQPNFDVIVYLDRATAGKLAFLEKHAERVQAQQHTATYRLTRDSVYRGLESGTSPLELLQGLQAGSEAALPQSVAVEIREWARLREKICLHRFGRLLEFPDLAGRQAALEAGAEGTPVGDRFLLLPDTPPGSGTLPQFAMSLDYLQPLPKCTSAHENGEIKLRTDPPDLLIEAQLDCWAERTGKGAWQLSQASVTAAIRRGRRIASLTELLSERLTHALPRLLLAALQAWAGLGAKVEISAVTLLRCKDGDVFEAIASSKMLKSYIRGQIAPGLLVVDTERVEALRERLTWAGFEVEELSI
jgi:hypothetical protein